MDKRLLDIKDLMKYTGLGRNRAMEFGTKIGAKVDLGLRKDLYDKNVIDDFIDYIVAQSANTKADMDNYELDFIEKHSQKNDYATHNVLIENCCFEENNNVVYFISDGNAIKIGKTTNLHQRIKTMETYVHTPLVIVCTFVCESRKGMNLLEKKFHDYFRKRKKRGEWFEISEDDIRKAKIELKTYINAYVSVEETKNPDIPFELLSADIQI